MFERPLTKHDGVKEGDWVMAIDNYYGHLIPGKRYEVLDLWDEGVHIVNEQGERISSYYSRFSKGRLKTLEELL